MVATCRNGDILEPTADQIEAGHSSCRYEGAATENMNNDFDIMRKAIDICEVPSSLTFGVSTEAQVCFNSVHLPFFSLQVEFALGSHANRRLLNSFRTAESCVARMMKAIHDQLRDPNGLYNASRDRRHPSIDLSRSVATYLSALSTIEINDKHDDHMNEDIVSYYRRYNSSCEPNWMWNLSQEEGRVR